MSATLGFSAGYGGPITTGTAFGTLPVDGSTSCPIVSTFIFVLGTAGQIACLNSAGESQVFQVVLGYNYLAITKVVASVTINAVVYNTTATNLWWGASGRA